MGVHVALLRGINVGGANRLAMADLKGLAAEVGLANPRTLLRSGNLVFGAGDDAAALEARLETALTARFGFDVDVMVRAEGDWRSLIEANPFTAEANEDPAHLVAVVLKSQPLADGMDRLRAMVTGPEVTRVVGCTAFVHYPAGIGGSRLTQPVIDRALGVRGTARNWNTVRKIGEMIAAF